MGKTTFFVCVALVFGANATTYDASTGYVTLLVGGTNSGDMPITTNVVTTAKRKGGVFLERPSRPPCRHELLRELEFPFLCACVNLFGDNLSGSLQPLRAAQRHDELQVRVSVEDGV